MPGRFTFGQMLALAALIHATLLVLGSHVPPPRPPDATVALALIPVELSPPTAPEPPPAPKDPVEPRSEPVAPAPRAVATRTDLPTSHATAVASALALPESAPATPEGWTLHVTTDPHGPPPGSRAMGTLGLDGTNHFMGRRETPEEARRNEAAQANRAAGEAMRGALHDHDVALGLGGGGPVVTALEAAVRESGAPDESAAVFVAIADASGRVLRVDVESATDGEAFRTIADDVLKRLQGLTLRVPAGSRGLAMRINVESKMALPSGGGLGIDPRSAGVHFDTADIGARARRVIHARVVAEQLL